MGVGYTYRDNNSLPLRGRVRVGVGYTYRIRKVPGEMYMPDTVEFLGSWRTGGIYNIGVAQRLTGVSSSAIKRWLSDYPAPIAELKPLWRDGMGPKFTRLTMLSFLELVELLIAGKIRASQNRGYREVREYHDTLIAEWGTQFPFAHKNLHSQKERLPKSAVQIMDQLDYDNGFASRWLPLGKDGALALDPQRAGGQPAIKGRRLRVVDISDTFAGGESIQEIAYNFDIDTAQVEAALRYAFLHTLRMPV